MARAGLALAVTEGRRRAAQQRLQPSAPCV